MITQQEHNELITYIDNLKPFNRRCFKTTFDRILFVILFSFVSLCHIIFWAAPIYLMWSTNAPFINAVIVTMAMSLPLLLFGGSCIVLTLRVAFCIDN